ncbi:MAG: hypothetical protein J6U85_00470 [Bacteroidales bacterium]|nr:hypothetical protein [Bacteroidales bacterium]
MKTLIKILLISLCLPLFISVKPMNSQETEAYTISKIYEKIELDRGSKAIDSWGNVEDA